MSLITLLVVVLLLCLVYWAVHRLASAFGLPPQMVVVIDVLLVVVFVVWVLSTLGVLPGMGLRL
jgi:hypothetical protein